MRTTISDKAAPYPLDRVNRQFRAPLHVAAGRVTAEEPAQTDPTA